MKQVKLRGGTNLSINKCAGEASIVSHISSASGCHWLHLSLSSLTCPLFLSVSLLGEALMRGNGFLDANQTTNGVAHGWLLEQQEWVQKYIVIVSEEQARKEEKSHQNAMNKYGQNLLTKFRDQVEEQNKKEWKNY